MGNAFEGLILGIVQALTEFLPVSSSGHIAVLGLLLSGQAVPLALNVAVHVGTLIATSCYFWRDIIGILREIFTRKNTTLIAAFFLGLLPAGIAGFTVKDKIEEISSSLPTVGVGFLITSAVLLATHIFGSKTQEAEAQSTTKPTLWPTPLTAFLIGLAQALAIMPGVSRSGMTIAAGILLGLRKQDAVTFSFIMSIPLILGASALEAKDISDLASANTQVVLWGFLASIIGGFLSLILLIKIIRLWKLHYFALYTFLLGIGCIASGT